MQSCTLRLPDCRNDQQTVVFAHAPSPDNGMGLKASQDFWGAFACAHCHDVVDGRTPILFDDHHLINRRWLAGIYETQKVLIEKGLITYDNK
jgi:hypothetical protein